jgi:hypothetical protein
VQNLQSVLFELTVCSSKLLHRTELILDNAFKFRLLCTKTNFFGLFSSWQTCIAAKLDDYWQIHQRNISPSRQLTLLLAEEYDCIKIALKLTSGNSFQMKTWQHISMFEYSSIFENADVK